MTDTHHNHRPIYKIAADIRKNWPNISPYAVPYLSAMARLDNLNDNYGYDSADGIILRFLSNASGWRGAKAREIKAELKAILANSH